MCNETNNPDLNFLGSGRVDFGNGDNTLNIPATDFAPQIEIGGIALSTTAFTAANVSRLLDGSNVDDLHTHSSFPLDVTTVGMAIGDCGYFSGAGACSKTDAEAEASSRFAGVHQGTDGQIVYSGPVVINMTTDGGNPAPGDPIYLAELSADTNTGAGKASATAPPPANVGSFVAEIGICGDNTDYPLLKTCAVLLQVKEIHER